MGELPLLSKKALDILMGTKAWGQLPQLYPWSIDWLGAWKHLPGSFQRAPGAWGHLPLVPLWSTSSGTFWWAPRQWKVEAQRLCYMNHQACCYRCMVIKNTGIKLHKVFHYPTLSTCSKNPNFNNSFILMCIKFIKYNLLGLYIFALLWFLITKLKCILHIFTNHIYINLKLIQ